MPLSLRHADAMLMPSLPLTLMPLLNMLSAAAATDDADDIEAIQFLLSMLFSRDTLSRRISEHDFRFIATPRCYALRAHARAARAHGA